jgi:membrane associated rhomboid family serine protease
MFTGTGDANTDIGAHFFGFVAGFGTGMLLTKAREKILDPKLQLLGGMATVLLIIAAWSVALLV